MLLVSARRQAFTINRNRKLTASYLVAINAQKPIEVHRVEEPELEVVLLAGSDHLTDDVRAAALVACVRDAVVVILRVPPCPRDCC